MMAVLLLAWACRSCRRYAAVRVLRRAEPVELF